MYICVYICTYIYICVYMCIYTYIYIYIYGDCLIMDLENQRSSQVGRERCQRKIACDFVPPLWLCIVMCFYWCVS